MEWDYRVHLDKWGEGLYGAELHDFRYNNVPNHDISTAINSLESIISACGGNQRFLTRCFAPKPASDRNLMAIYATGADRVKSPAKVTIGKPAKMLRKIFPTVSETDANSFAVWWKEKFVALADGLTVKSGKERKDFKHAYRHENAKCIDPYLGGIFKSLHGSCMRFEFYNQAHPSEIYASGDFTQYWVETNEGKIAARCIVRTDIDPISAGPIYTSSNAASDVLKTHLEGLNADFDSNWTGAKLLKINGPESDSFVTAYVDGFDWAGDDGDFWTIEDGDGKFEINTARGYSYAEGEDRYTCDSCEEGISEDDVTFVNDSCLCSSCLNRDYTWVDSRDEYIHNSDLVEVNSINLWGQVRSDYRHPEDDSFFYCEGSYNYWAYSCGIAVADGDVYSASYVNEYYFLSNEDNKYYPNEDKAELPNGDCITKEQAEDKGLVCLDGVWVDGEAYEVIMTTKDGEETESLKLRDNYELDALGNPARNPDFLDLMLEG